MQNAVPDIERNADTFGDDKMSINDLSCTNEPDEITSDDIYAIIRDLRDPEHAELNLAELGILRSDYCKVDGIHVNVQFRPTSTTCSLATIIGLLIKVKLTQALPKYYRIHVSVVEGTHNEDSLIGKKLNDKERLTALNNIVWPEISRLALARAEELWKAGVQVVVLDAAVLLEAGWEAACHEVWVCVVPRSEAVQRIVERGGQSGRAQL